MRGKPGAWDPNLCLLWGEQFLKRVDSLTKGKSRIGAVSTDNDSDKGASLTPKDQNVWRVHFEPSRGVDIRLLNLDEVEEVRNGEERVGFLPMSYWRTVSESLKS